MGVDTSNVTSSLFGAARYDAQLYAQTGSYTGMLTRYTGGLTPSSPGNQYYAQAFTAAQTADAGGGGGGSFVTMGDPSTAGGFTAPSTDQGDFSSADPHTADSSDFSTPTTDEGDFSSADPVVSVPTGGFGGVPPTGNFPPVTISSQPGALSHPFTWIYQQLITSTQRTLTFEIGQMQAMVNTYLLKLLVVALMLYAVRSACGASQATNLLMFGVHACWVVPVVANGSALYNEFVVQPVIGLPSWWQQYIVGVAGQTSSPVAMFDWFYNATYATEVTIWQATPWSLRMIWVGPALLVAWLVMVWALIKMFIPYGGVILLLMIMLVIGPIMIPAVMFERSHFVAVTWFWVTATLLLSMLAIGVLVAFYAALMVQLMQALNVTGTPQTDYVSFAGAAAIMYGLGKIAEHVPRLIERIGGGVTVSMGEAGKHMSGAWVMLPIRAATAASPKLAVARAITRI